MIVETNIEKWSRAVVNIESRSRIGEKEAYEKLRRKEISHQEFGVLLDKVQITRSTGTLIFFKHNDLHYFITARHVVEDEENEGKTAHKLLLIKNGSQVHQNFQYDDKDQILLMNFSAGSPDLRRYVFSSKEDDLAILALNFFEGEDLIKTLYKRGYIPVTLDDIDTRCLLSIRQEITCLGFPGDMSELDRDPIPAEKMNWSSDIISLPVISQGIVTDPLPDKNYFYGGISINKGNSGGPIVSHNKLIGIVSRWEPALEMLKAPTLNYYIRRNTYFSKSSLILGMIEQLEHIRSQTPGFRVSEKKG